VAVGAAEDDGWERDPDGFGDPAAGFGGEVEGEQAEVDDGEDRPGGPVFEVESFGPERVVGGLRGPQADVARDRGALGRGDVVSGDSGFQGGAPSQGQVGELRRAIQRLHR
jgi:hypothetical protein